jgi:integrase
LLCARRRVPGSLLVGGGHEDLGAVVQARKRWGERVPVIPPRDLRRTHATLALADGVPVRVVSERLGHANATITLTVYQHVYPDVGRQAGDRFAALLEG